jgi:hypothetical protein
MYAGATRADVRRLEGRSRRPDKSVKKTMRLIALVVTATLVSPSAMDAQQQSSASDTQLSARKDTKEAKQKDATSLNLPVSLDRIREALEQPPVEPLKGLDERPQFRVEIRERQKLDELIQSMDFKSGPAVPGGLYGYEQQQVLFPKVNNPLVQPYAAFSQSQLAVTSLEALLEKYLAGRVMNGLSSASRAAAQASARQEVERAIAEYCAAQEHHGAGIEICDSSIKP